MDNKQGDIIQAVEQCLRRNGCSSCENCPYTYVGDGFECREKLKDDIIALLKAQEPVDAIKREQDEQEDRERPPLPPIRHEDLCLVFLCPECGCDLRYYRCERCYRCGRRVKWE